MTVGLKIVLLVSRYKIRLGSLLLEGDTVDSNPFLQVIPVKTIVVHKVITKYSPF